MATVLDRVTAEISRNAEYFSAKELQAMTGQPQERFAIVIDKELIDNALDGCESAGVQPEITLDWAGDEQTLILSVADNGKGIPPETIDRILDFSVRVSDKALYRSPSRGAQGNALKTIIGMPFALGSDSPVIIESQGVRHIIRAWVDPLGSVMVDHRREDNDAVGTRVTVEIPTGRQTKSFGYLTHSFAVFNPHALVRIREYEKNEINYLANFPDGALLKSEETYQPIVRFPGEWRKFLPTDLTSPHWYTEDALEKLIYAHVKDHDLPLRAFIKQFKGLSPNAKAKLVCDQFDISRLSECQDSKVVADLLAVMKNETQSPKPETLGFVGEDHFRQLLDQLFGVKRHWYKRQSLELNGISYLIEVMVAETEQLGGLYHGVNFSPTFEDPISNTPVPGKEFAAYGLCGFLARAYCNPYKNNEFTGSHTAVAFHLVSPSLEFLGQRPATINRALAALSALFTWAVESKHITVNPVAGIKKVQEVRPAPKALGRLDQLALMRAVQAKKKTRHESI